MGEYAIRKSDGQRIKIGTCEDMYYLRFEDREKVTHERGNVDPVADAHELRFRLPFPDEDEIEPGGRYEDFERSQPLYRSSPTGSTWFDDPETADHPGTIQLHHKSGLLLNVPCYHGARLPEVGPNIKAFWNGKSPSLVLSSLRGTKDEQGNFRLVPVVRCQHCGEAWRYKWEQLTEYIPLDMWRRLREYAPGVERLVPAGS